MRTDDQRANARGQLADLLYQIHVLQRFATQKGLAIPASAIDALAQLTLVTEEPSVTGPAERPPLEQRIDALPLNGVSEAMRIAFPLHGVLCHLVTPATPESLIATQPRQGIARLLHFSVIKVLTISAVSGLVAYGYGLTHLPSSGPSTGTIEFGEAVLYTGAALIGASFSEICTALKYVTERTYDPKFDATYYLRLLLGVIAGFILALFGPDLIGAEKGNGLEWVAAPSLLALIGGYSAEGVSAILRRISDTIVALVKGSADAVLEAKEQELQVQQKLTDLKIKKDMIAALSGLLPEAKDPALAEQIRKMIESLLADGPEQPGG